MTVSLLTWERVRLDEERQGRVRMLEEQCSIIREELPLAATRPWTRKLLLNELLKSNRNNSTIQFNNSRCIPNPHPNPTPTLI